MTISNFWKPSTNFKLPFGTDFESLDPKRKKLLKVLGIVGASFFALALVVAILLFVFVIKPSLAVLSQVNKLKEDQMLVQKAFKNQDIDAINLSLETLKNDLETLRNVRDASFPWAAKFGPFVNYYTDSNHFITAGTLAVDALKEFVVVAEPFADAAGFKKNDIVITDSSAPSGFAEAFATWVRIMPEVAGNMDGVIDKFDKVGDELSLVDARRYPQSISGFPVRSNIEAAQQYLTQASEYGPDIKAALTIIPPLLGVGQEKRYAIIMQNDAEIRPTGGFWTNYATFRILNAALNSDFSSKDMYSMDEIIATTDTIYTSPFPKPLAPYRDFLKVEHTYARDANFSPDFVTAVDSWMWYYKFVGRIQPLEAKPINGVFAIDTHVIEELLRVTGPVDVNGVSYSADNVVLELEKIASLGLKEQQGRKKVLGDLMESMLINMYRSESNLWPKFVETGIRLAVEKHAFAYVFPTQDEQTVRAQELLEKYNFSGRIQETKGEDYSFVVSTNLGGDKTNTFVTKEVEHKILEENGKWVHDVTIDYKYGQPKPGYEPLVTVYRDWIRVYAPLGAKLLVLEGSDAKTEADTGEERGKVYFAGHLTLAPNESKTIRFKYELPDGVVKSGLYSVYLQKQGGTSDDLHKVTFNGRTMEEKLVTDKTLTFR
ncbi:MAG: DUF4012 domain-containing protein [Patescibacteria group bacterium]